MVRARLTSRECWNIPLSKGRLQYMKLFLCLQTVRILLGTRALLFLLVFAFSCLLLVTSQFLWVILLPMEEKKKILPISTPFLYLVWTKLLYCFNNVFTKKIATFWKSDSLFQLSPGFPITTTTAELLISVQSCFLLVPLGLQLCHHVADKVTLCLGWLLEGEARLASTRADRPHTWGIKGQTHCKLDCD